MKKLSFAPFSLLFTLFLIVGCNQVTEETQDRSRPTLTATIDREDAFTKQNEKTTVSFYAVGDNLIHMPIVNYAQTGEDAFDFQPIYQNIAEDIQTADLAFINQETILGGDDRGYSGYPSFNTPSDMAGSLVDLGFDIVAGSNNHSLDMGTSGILNTLDYWDNYSDQVLFTGVFETQAHRDQIPMIEKNGLTFSVLTYTYGTNGVIADTPYRVNYFDQELIRNDVNRAQELSDFVMVAAHWGDEHSFQPNQMQLDYAQFFADLGVDVVIGSHSHTIQPIEWVTGEAGNETLVVYSLGNIMASSIVDINLLGGAVAFDFVAHEDELSIENVSFEPLVIHYEETEPGNIDSRSHFKVHKLVDYEDEIAERHALTGYQDNIIQRENYMEMVHEVIPADFLP